eukprot:scaffold174379_cov35-Tisochrysis_lutea.AAC.2
MSSKAAASSMTCATSESSPAATRGRPESTRVKVALRASTVWIRLRRRARSGEGSSPRGMLAPAARAFASGLTVERREMVGPSSDCAKVASRPSFVRRTAPRSAPGLACAVSRAEHSGSLGGREHMAAETSASSRVGMPSSTKAGSGAGGMPRVPLPATSASTAFMAHSIMALCVASVGALSSGGTVVNHIVSAKREPCVSRSTECRLGTPLPNETRRPASGKMTVSAACTSGDKEPY